MRGLVVHQDARCVRNRELRFFDGACFLTRAFLYQRIIDTAVKRAPSNALKTKVRWSFQVFLTHGENHRTLLYS